MRRKSAPVGVEALSAAHADRLRRDIDAAGDDLHVLRARSLVTVDDGLTAAGLLLLGEHPQLSLPHALVRVLRYQADETGVGSRQTMAADGDRRLEGAIPDVIDAALALVDEWGPRRRALKADGRLGPVDVIPREAWMEAVVNAVVHRSYSMAGDHIRVSIFPHRIEVSSPGRFPGLVDLYLYERHCQARRLRPSHGVGCRTGWEGCAGYRVPPRAFQPRASR